MFTIQEDSVRNATIQRYNKLLSDKMDHIMRTGGYTDHRNNYISRRYVRTKQNNDN